MRNARTAILIIVLLTITGLLLSCNESQIATDNSTEQLMTANVNALAAKQAQKDSPQKVFSEFEEMVEKVQKMDQSEIQNLSDDEILELGEPILKATEGTVKLSKSTLQTLREPLAELKENVRSLTKDKHTVLSDEIEKIIAADKKEKRNFNAENVQELLLKFNGGENTLLSTCESLFNVQGNIVTLVVGDNFNLANSICPANSYFVISQGTHYNEYVENSKDTNYWVGTTSAIMDGQNQVNKAFKNGMKNNFISGFTIKRYKEHGIYSTSSSTENVDITYMTFEKIGAGKDGEYFGAIRFDNAEDLFVRYSYFEDVASGVLFTDTDGPLKVLDNEALNSGRNFFQCANCSGGGIRINGNSMDRTSSSYGSVDLEDWISIVNSDGLNGDWIQVNNNRARGHSSSASGSFIILGDAGGEYQEAVGNIGVNPGQVGIGAAGGDDIKVEDNKMYSVSWAQSNVAFYSAEFSSPCSDHDFPASPDPNVAHWKNSSGTLNRAWSDGDCGVTNAQILSNVDEDTDMDEDIWNDW